MLNLKITVRQIIFIGTILLFIGIFSVLISASLDNKNLITTSYLRDRKLEAKAEINSPVLSNSPEPTAQPWLFLEYVLAAVGGVFYIPILIIHIFQLLLVLLQFIIESILNQISDFVKWIIGGIAAIIILCCSFVGIPLTQSSVNTTPTPIPSIPSNSIRPLGPNEGIYYATLHVTAPPYIKQGQSQILELNFNLADQNIDGAIPIILPQANTYTVTVNTQLVNFDLASPASELQDNRPVNINQPVKWQWVVAPKAEAEGNQSVIWTLELKDGLGVTYQDFPTVKLEIQIKPKLGIPSWILGPNFTLGALISGILLNGVGNFIKKKKEKEEREENKWIEESIKIGRKVYSLLIVNPVYGVVVYVNPKWKVPTIVHTYSRSNFHLAPEWEFLNEADIEHRLLDNFGIAVTDVSIVQQKTTKTHFYVLCSTSASKINSITDFGTIYSFKWTKNFRAIKVREARIDEEIVGLIRNRYSQKSRLQ